MNKTNTNTAAKNHPNYSRSDYAALAAKGYSDAEIIAIWDNDRRHGNTEPLIRKPIPNYTSLVDGPDTYKATQTRDQAAGRRPACSARFLGMNLKGL